MPGTHQLPQELVPSRFQQCNRPFRPRMQSDTATSRRDSPANSRGSPAATTPGGSSQGGASALATDAAAASGQVEAECGDCVEEEQAYTVVHNGMIITNVPASEVSNVRPVPLATSAPASGLLCSACRARCAAMVGVAGVPATHCNQGLLSRQPTQPFPARDHGRLCPAFLQPALAISPTCCGLPACAPPCPDVCR